MSQLRLAFSNLQAVPRQTRSKKSRPSPVVLDHWQPLFWKLERLDDLRPAAVDVIEKLVDDLLREAEGRKL